MTSVNDTIFALSSGGLPSGVAVVRISGPRAFAVKELIGQLPDAHRASLRTIRTRNGLVLDRGLVIAFRGPASFTGDDCVEFHIHGGKAIVTALLAELASIDSFRAAEQGEFSRRAMENGKLDLVEIEGLADLLSAETEMQRRLAVEQASGGLSRLYHGWANRITHARALIEAELDFADEDDVPGSVSDQVWSDMAALRSDLEEHLTGAHFGEIVRDGLNVVITGAPNSGKSSLLNALSGRDVAIVTNVAGTTRDVLEVNLDINGYAVRLYDTAGIRDTQDVVEQEGVRRALRTIESADIILSLAEIGLDAETNYLDFRGKLITVGTKCDLVQNDGEVYDLEISVKTGAGLKTLRELISYELARLAGSHSMAIPSRMRHRQLLTDACTELESALNEELPLDLKAEFLRSCANSLGRITGHVDVEDLLDVIFSEFCIGK